MIGLTVIAVYLYSNKSVHLIEVNENVSPTISPTPTDVPTEAPISDNEKPTNNFNVEYIIIRDQRKILLYDNSKERLTSAEALKKYECDKLISGGFWREDTGGALGLLVSEGELISKVNQNSLLNGFFTVDSDNKSSAISETEPDLDNTRIAIQAGPILFNSNLPIPIKAENDEGVRRIVVAKTFKGETLFLVFYYKPSPIIGPKLKDLPTLLDDLDKKTNLKIESAMNLDGGAHSTFVSGDINLSEIARVGSFFCIKP